MSNAIDSPVYAIKVDGKDLTPAYMSSLLSLSVTDELNLPAMFEMKFSSISIGDEDYQGLSLDFFKPGGEVKISMGIDQPTALMVGEIAGIDPTFGDCSAVTIRGYDRLYKLGFGSKWKVFTQKSDSQIAAEMAGKYSLSTSTDDTGIKLAYLLQNNLSDLKFLTKRVQQLQFEMWVEDRKFFFKQSREGAAAVATLNYPGDIEELDLNLKVLDEGSRVTVVGWDVKTKKMFQGSDSDDQKMGGQESGYKASQKFPDSAITLTDLTVDSAGSAKKLAKAESSSHLSRFIEGEGKCPGDPRLKAGKNINIEQLGKRFSGLYYITASTHTFDQDQGYRTSFKLRRTGV